MDKMTDLEKEIYEYIGLEPSQKPTRAERRAAVKNNALPLRAMLDRLVQIFPDFTIKEKMIDEKNKVCNRILMNLSIRAPEPNEPDDDYNPSSFAFTIHTNKYFTSAHISSQNPNGGTDYYNSYGLCSDVSLSQAQKMLIRWAAEHAKHNGLEDKLAQNLKNIRLVDVRRARRNALHARSKNKMKP